MKFIDLKKNLINGIDSTIFYVYGEDAFFREKSVSMLTQKYVSNVEINSAFFDGEDVIANVGNLISAISQYPFLSEKRIVIIREFYPKSDFFKTYFSNLIINPIKETIIVFLNSNFSEVLSKTEGITLIDCNKADISVLSRYIIKETEKSGEKISTETAEKICEYCLSDMTKIANETAKLISYSLDKGFIDNNDVEKLCYKDCEYQIYEMTDCIGKKKNDKALLIIKELLSKGEAPQRLIVSIYNYYNRLLSIALSDLSDKELAKNLNIKEYAVKKSREQLKLFTKKNLKKNIDIITEYDFKVKTGKIDFLDALDIITLKMMA